MALKKFERSIFEVFFGYRSLLDWADSGSWARGARGSISASEQTVENPLGMLEAGIVGQSSAKLSGPHQFKSGKRPRLNFWGQDNTSAKVPGQYGFYFDVHDPTPQAGAPSGRWPATKGDDVQATINAMIDDMDIHTQQWLYLAAENMAKHGRKLLSSNKITDDELERVQNLLDIEEGYGMEEGAPGMTTRETTIETMMGGTGSGDPHMAEMVRPMVEKDIKIHEDTGLPVKIASRVQVESTGEGAQTRQMGQHLARGADVWPSGFGAHKIGKNDPWLKTMDPKRFRHEAMMSGDPSPTSGEQQFRTMLTGVKGQWIDSFAASVIKTVGPEGIELLSNKVETFIDEKIRKSSIEGGGKIYAPLVSKGMGYYQQGKGPDTYGPATGDLAAAGGQTPQELAAVGAAIGTGEFLKREGKSVGKGIDIMFNKNVYLPWSKMRKGRRPFRKVDLTTSFYREGGHHGIGKVGLKKLPPETPIKESEDFIRRYYYEDRIPTYNFLIKYVMEATGTNKIGGKSNRGKIYEARQKWAHMTGSKRTSFSYTNPKTGKTEQYGRGQGKKISQKEIITKGRAAGLELAFDSIGEDLKWVLHHMANMLPGGRHDPAPYAMTAPFRISETNVGLLFVVFELNQDGTYKQMDMTPENGVNGSYVYIDSRTPMEWLYERAQDEGFEGTFREFADMGSKATAAQTLGGYRTEGILAQRVAESGGAINSQITYSAISAPDVSQTLRRITDALFSSIKEEWAQELQQQLHDDAVRFSIKARNPGAMKDMEKWYNFATEYLMTRKLSDSKAADYMKSSNLSTGQYEANQTAVWQLFGKSAFSGTRRDPFWYLWAAPYVSRKRVGVGGGQTGFIGD